MFTEIILREQIRQYKCTLEHSQIVSRRTEKKAVKNKCNLQYVHNEQATKVVHSCVRAKKQPGADGP